ncbi:MAG: VanZ family protein [Desulfobacterales bacterium]
MRVFKPYLQKTAAGAFIGLLAGITYLALTPITHEVSTLCWDKLNHLGAYFCLGILIDLGFLTGSRLGWKLCLLLAYSFLIETAQHFIPNRQFSGFDMFANRLGLILAYLALRAIQKTQAYESFQHQ